MVHGPVLADLVGDQMFAVVRLLDSEHGLRRTLADPTKPSAEKAAVARRLLHGKVSAESEDLVAEVVAARWATPGDLSDAVEQLAIEAFTLAAQYGGTLDDLEDDLFRFGRLVSGQPSLRSALIGPAPVDAKRSLLDNLLSGKVSSTIAEPDRAGADAPARSVAASTCWTCAPASPPDGGSSSSRWCASPAS